MYKSFWIRCLIKKRTGYYILAHKCLVLSGKKRKKTLTFQNIDSDNINKSKLLPEHINS